MKKTGTAAILTLFLTLGCMTISGCEQADSSGKTEQPTKSDTDSETKPEEITLKVGDEKDLQKLLDAHKGKVILVDFWATWCAPCVSYFPHVVELSEKHVEEGLAVISVSNDDPENSLEAALAFLKKKNATFDNLLSTYGIGVETGEKFQFPGSVPYYKLYDRNGKLRYQFSEQVETLSKEEWPGLEPIETTEEGKPPVNHLENRLKELLAEKADS